MIGKLLVYTEGSPEIGLGHLVECVSLVDSLKKDKRIDEELFLVNGDESANKFLLSRGINFQLVKEGYIADDDISIKYNTVLVNKKRVEYDFLKRLKGKAGKLVVIDELGRKKITADILINFSIDKEKHKYEFPDTIPITYFGPENFLASQALIEAMRGSKPAEVKTILISMGGYDSSGTTETILEILNAGFKEYKKEVILGPGFKENDSFIRSKDSLDSTFDFYESVDDLPVRILNAFFVINSGGNTLYEAALLKTPVLVIGEDPHEIEQGKIFEEKGFALNVADGKNSSKQSIQDSIGKMITETFDFNNMFKLNRWYDSAI